LNLAPLLNVAKPRAMLCGIARAATRVLARS
jgi:hypothetical protein